MLNTREVAKEYRLAHWTQIMQERVENGLSIKDYCKQIGICQNTYFYWQRRIRTAACEQLGKPALIQKPAPSFSEVMVVEPSAPLPSAEAVPQLRIEISGIQITADSSYPPEKLAALLRELRC